MIKHIFFDLDNTLMLSRTKMTPEHDKLFKKLCDKKDVVVISGAQESQLRTQIRESLRARFYVLGQMGNQAIDKEGTVMWEEKFSEKQTRAVYDLIEKIKAELALTVQDPSDLVEHRGSQISYSAIANATPA